MKNNAIKFRQFVFYIIFLICISNLRADVPEKQVDVHKILEHAEETLYQNGVTKVVIEEPAFSGKWIITKYYYKNDKNEKFSYKNGIFRINTHIATNILVTRPDGEWSISQDIAIRRPDEYSLVMREKNAVYHPRQTVMGKTEDSTIDGDPCIRVSFIISPEGKTILLQSTTETALQKTNNGNKSVAGKTAGPSVPHRCEYFISKKTGIIVMERIFSERGKKLSESKVTEIERNCDFPISGFAISTNYKMLYPSTASDYLAAIRVYADTKKTTTNKNDKKQ